jgi:predicted aspartyl protease
MKVGRARIKNVRAIVMEDDSLDTSDGLLGMSFLNNFTFHMDPSEGQLTLKKK